MTQPTSIRRLETRLFLTAAFIASLPLIAAVASAQTNAGAAPPSSHLDPRAIDAAVTEFTGVPVGEVGGARTPADPRLRLAPCAQPLLVDWHGTSETTVTVECAGPSAWRIFVSLRGAPATSRAAPLVARGDPITVVVRGRGFSVQQAGEAMEAGSPGDWIAIRTAREAEPVRARIERPGLAVIPAP